VDDAEQEQLIKAVSGDSDALSDLLQKHGPSVRSAIGPAIGKQWSSVLDADDVMQVTYLEAFLQIDRFKPAGEGSFRAWLKRIADNNLRDAIKGLQRLKRPQPSRRVTVPANRADSCVALFEILGYTSTTPSRDAMRREVQAVIEATITKLAPDYELVVRQCDLKGLPVSEVAAELGRSEAAVYMLRARAHEQLRRYLGSETRFID